MDVLALVYIVPRWDRVGFSGRAPDCYGSTGIGLSDRVPGRRLLDWASDIKMLAEVLDLPRIAILG